MIQIDAREGKLLASQPNSETVERLSPVERDTLAVAMLGPLQGGRNRPGAPGDREAIAADGFCLRCGRARTGVLPGPVAGRRDPLSARRGPRAAPASRGDALVGGRRAAMSTLFVLDRSRLLFSGIRMPWERWVEAWEELKSRRTARTLRIHPSERMWSGGPVVRLLP